MKRKCEICEETKTKVIFRQKFILPTKNYFHSGYLVSVCDKCNFAFADGIPSQEYIDNYYRAMSKKTSLIKRNIKIDKKIHLNFLDKQYKVSLKNILKYVKKTDRVLDVGCYTGGLLYLLKNKDFKNIEGLDTSEYAAIIGKKNFGVKISVGSVFDDLKIGKFDFIILTHVIEHIRNLDTFIRRLYSLLNEGGHVYVEMPDAHNFFIPKDNDEKFSNDQKEPFLQFSVEHINYFTKISISNLMFNRGFSKVMLKSELSHVAVISSVWKKNNYIKDNLVSKSLKQYVNNSKNKLKKAFSIINHLVKIKKEVYVWGAGLHTQKLLSLSNMKKIKIKAFVDVDPYYYGGKLVSRPIISPEDIINSEKLSIVISSKFFLEDIKKQIKNMKLKNGIITLY
jgi:SAM-dependent methyltransferase